MQRPSLEEVRAYCIERMNAIDPETFLAFYNANGWVQGTGRKPIKDWKACMITWEKRQPKKQGFIERHSSRKWAE